MGQEIDGKSNVVSATPVINTVQYSAGDLIGGLLTFTDALGERRSGVVLSVILTDLAKQSSNIDVIFFDSNPTNTTFTNNAALTIADADLTKVVGALSLTTYIALADNSFAYANSVNLVIKQTAGKDLYACLVARGTPTYAVGDLSLRVGILQD